MANFDPAAFASGLVGPLEDAVKANLPAFQQDAQEVLERVKLLRRDVQATLLSLAAEQDPDVRRFLQDDLGRFLPARKDSIMAIVASKLASDGQATFDAVLNVVVKAAVIAAKAFI